jgi:hypothetical protein
LLLPQVVNLSTIANSRSWLGAVNLSRHNSFSSPQQIVNQTYCLDKFREGVSPDLNITDLQICAMWPGGGRDTCSGDSGGPLVRYDINEPLVCASSVAALPCWGTSLASYV